MKPILFSTAMVRAIIDGEKTCTRRIIKKEIPGGYKPLGFVLYPTDDKELGNLVFGGKGANVYYAKPPYKVGDILYVRETFRWQLVGEFDSWGDCNWDDEVVEYKASVNEFLEEYGEYLDREEYESTRWIPSIHMPKELARIFLKVTSVRAERLKDITDEGCYQEGISSTSFYDEAEHIQIAGIGLNDSLERAAFSLLWNSTVKEEKYSWEGNPWVWVIEFEKVEKQEIGE
ncbi:hypothetical protein CP118TE_12780 [Clostridium perfringens E]|uniref:hypothetical protein n=1 Tax=Clostridium perfringens TaxID=1502 RepID=UPI00220CE9C7|nr:hypothetical protein [Clostridium perfringens]BDC01569.1 hypothetical protein CP118TE_12780 [Clostridium perfringens E]